MKHDKINTYCNAGSDYGLEIIRKIIAVCVFVMLCGFFLPGCGNEQSGGGHAQPGSGRVSETRLFLDTICTITIGGTDGADNDGGSEGDGNADGGSAAGTVLDEAFEICRSLELLLSVTSEGSDIWRINHAQGQPVTVAPETLEVIQRGIVFGELSDGMFDITIGRLSRLWDFGSGQAHIPSDAEITEAAGSVDFRQIQIITGSDDSAQILINPGLAMKNNAATNRHGQMLPDSGAWIDLGAIAKGYIADKIAEFLTASGVDSALVDLGGDIYAVGNRPDGSPWRLAVRHPFGSMDEYIGVLEITDAAVVSSGVYERQFEVDGVLYHHILNPDTGMPAHSDVISATLVTKDAVTGEGLSTIAVLAGSGRVQPIFEQTPGFIGAVLVLNTGDVLTYGDVNFKLNDE